MEYNLTYMKLSGTKKGFTHSATISVTWSNAL